MSQSRSIAAMMAGEESREHSKNKAKVAALHSPAALAQSRLTPAEAQQAAKALARKENAAAQQSHMLKGVLSAKTVQSILHAPAPAPKPVAAAAPAGPRPTLIVHSDPRHDRSAAKKAKKKSVTLDESDVMFSTDFDDAALVAASAAVAAASSKKKKKASTVAAASAPTPMAVEPNAEEAAAAQAASLKKLKHRNFRANAEPASSVAASSVAAATPADPFAPAPRALSKAERKKLEKIATAKIKKAERAQTLAILHASQMSPAQHKLLLSSTKMGQKATLKQQLRRQFIEQKAGIAADDDDDADMADASTRGKSISLTQHTPRASFPERNSAAALDFFASTISPHTKAPKPKAPKLPSELPATSIHFGDDFGSFRSSALSSLKSKGDGDGNDLGRGYVAGYIKAGKNSMAELEREQKEREEEEDEESDDEEEEEGEDEEGEDDDDEGEDDEDAEDDEEEEEEEEPVLPASNIYSVAFDVKPIRANKKKRKRVALVLPGQAAAAEEEPESESEAEPEADEEAMEDEAADKSAEEEDADAEEEADEEPEPPQPKKKQRQDAKQSKSAAAAAADPAAESDDEPQGPRLSRKEAKLANASVIVAKTFEAGKKFSRVKQDGPSALYSSLLKAREEKGGTVAAYPGTETLAHFRVSNNDLYLGDLEQGKAVDKGKKKKPTASTPVAQHPPKPDPRMPTLRTTPSGHTIVEVHRTEEIQASRMQLPICSQEQEVMEAIMENDVVILSGETGSGKTTQVPQFLFEAGYSLASGDKPGLIGVTEPRRVAAMATAKRVAQELNVWNPEESKLMTKLAERARAKSGAKAAASDAAAGIVAGGTAGEDAADIVDLTLVSYQVRYTSLSTASTRIKFMTDGILLREIQSDFLISKYSVIIVDEAHERGINTDILIGLLSKIVPLRNKLARKYFAARAEREAAAVAQGKPKSAADLSGLSPVYPLKLIIMSATLRLGDFTNNTTLFPRPPPVISVAARQYPVTVHFHKFTPLGDWTNHALKMLVKMHAKLPKGADNSGGILVFLTGKDEIDSMVTKVRSLFDEKRNREERNKIKLTQALEDARAGEEDEDRKTSASSITSKSKPKSTALKPVNEDDPNDPVFDLHISDDDNDEAVGDESRFAEADAAEVAPGATGDDEEGEKGVDVAAGEKKKLDPVMLEQQLRELADSASAPVHVLPLYSLLPVHEQMKIFAPPPSPAHRLIVLSTNVAETSLTIPGIRYVLDCGREKARVYDRVTGTSQYVVQFISQASAAQRSGRSGRVGPGHAYRLYSSTVFGESMEKFAPPEILRNPLEATILQMKSMSIPDLTHFPFPTPPEPTSLKLAIKGLELLGAVESTGTHPVTELGRLLGAFPVAPRFGKMLVLACQAPKLQTQGPDDRVSLLSYMIRIVASLSVEQMFQVPDFNKTADEEAEEEEDDEDAEESAKLAAQDPIAARAREKARLIAARKKDSKRAAQKLYNASQARWRHPTSDVLTMLRAMGGYEFALADNAPARTPANAAPAVQKAAAAQRQLHAHRCLQFLHENFLRVKAMEEILSLRKQLEKISKEMIEYNIEVAEGGETQKGYDPTDAKGEEASTEVVVKVATSAASASSSSAAASNSLPATHPYNRLLSSLASRVPLRPPTATQESLLLQILTAGFIDHVARRMSPERKSALIEKFKQNMDLSDAEHSKGLDLSGAYECIKNPDEAVFIHPSSVLFAPENQPEYLIYGELVRTRKVYMRACTALTDLTWLEKYGGHLITYSAHYTAEPFPIYDASRDAVLAYRDVVFGPLRWQLPRSTTELEAGSAEKAKHFLRLLMQGAVIAPLKKFVPYLLFKSSSITGSDVAGQLSKNLSALIAPFVKNKIDSRAALEQAWKAEPSFFKKEYLSWIQPTQHEAINKMWPPVAREAKRK